MGLLDRKNKNARLRAGGVEPMLGSWLNVKRVARHFRRAGAPEVMIKKPERYLHSHARRAAARPA